MRVLMITERFPPEVRSAAHLFHDLAREFQRRGHDIAVITKASAQYVTDGETRKALLGWGNFDGIRTLRVRGFPLASHHPLVRALDHLTLGASVGRAARHCPNADVVLVYSPPLPLAGAGGRYQRRFGAPFVLNVQDLYPQTAIDLGLLRNRPAIALAERMERRAYQQAARIVVHSPGNRAFLLQRKGVPGDKVRVISNWVDIDALRPGPRENGFRVEQGLSEKFVVSYAGLMGYAQDLGTVIECAAVLEADADVVFLLVGEGVLESRWKKVVAERGLRNVRFLPMQSRKRYAQLLTASDVCLVPLDGALRTPVVPGKLQSIMACGRPAIAIVDPGGDTPQLIAESGGGIAVPPGRPAALAGVIRRLKADQALCEEMGRRGRAFAEANFSIVRSADAYEDLFAEVLSDRGRSGARV
jgi:glycosyltransferase involved in cell wall biosynthesis